MEQMVRMRQKGATVRFLDRFGGFCATETPVAGQWAWEENLSAHRYPALSTRLPRREVSVTDAGGGLLAKEHLWYVSGSKLRHDGVAVELGLTEGEKQMVSMGAYLLVWPDKKYVNTADITDCGSTDIRVKAHGFDGDEGFEVTLGGDCELETIIRALKFITKVLEDQAKEVYD